MPLIKCPECHKKVSSTVEKCIHCGYDIASINNEQLNTSTSKTKQNKVVVPIVVGVTVVVALSITVTQILSPKSRFERAIKTGDISSAVSIYCNNETNSKFVTFADQRISEYLEEVVQAYGAGTSSWANALANCDVLSRAVDTHYYTERIDNISESKTNYLKGVECDANGDIIGAFSAFTSITEDDTQNYSDARNWIDTKGKECVDAIVSKADNFAEKNNYEEAANTIREVAYAIDDADVKEKYAAYQLQADLNFVRSHKDEFTVTQLDGSGEYVITIYDSKKYGILEQNYRAGGIFPYIVVNDTSAGFALSVGCEVDSQLNTNEIIFETEKSKIVIPISQNDLTISSPDKHGNITESCMLYHDDSVDSNGGINLEALIDSFNGVYKNGKITLSGSKGETTFTLYYHEIKSVLEGWRLAQVFRRYPFMVEEMQ